MTTGLFCRTGRKLYGKYGPGNFVDTSGKRLGEHKGYPNYTIGQRKGLGIALGQPMFVIAIHPEDNTVVLGTKEELQGKSFFAKEINLMKYAKIPTGWKSPPRSATGMKGRKLLYIREDNRLRVVFHETMDSITPGQSAVFYEGEDVVGGGVIEGKRL